MRVRGAQLSWLGALLLGVSGCWTTEPSLKPPPHPEEFALPPTDDSRFSAPLEYPKNTLDDPLLKKPDNDPNKFPDPSRFSASPGTRGN